MFDKRIYDLSTVLLAYVEYMGRLKNAPYTQYRLLYDGGKVRGNTDVAGKALSAGMLEEKALLQYFVRAKEYTEQIIEYLEKETRVEQEEVEQEKG